MEEGENIRDRSFIIGLSDEIRSYAEVFSRRMIADDARRAQDYALISSIISIAYQVGIISVAKIQNPVADVSLVIGQKPVQLSGFMIVIALFFAIRFYIYFFNDVIVLRVDRFKAALQLDDLNDKLSRLSLDEPDPERRRQAVMAHQALVTLVKHSTLSDRIRWIVDYLFVGLVWICSVGVFVIYFK